MLTSSKLLTLRRSGHDVVDDNLPLNPDDDFPSAEGSSTSILSDDDPRRAVFLFVAADKACVWQPIVLKAFEPVYAGI